MVRELVQVVFLLPLLTVACFSVWREERQRILISSRAEKRFASSMAGSITIQCEPCIRANVKMAHAKGVSQDELIEFSKLS